LHRWNSRESLSTSAIRGANRPPIVDGRASMEPVMHSANESTYFFRSAETTPRVLNVVDVVAGLVRSYLDWRRQQADIAMLQALSTRQLEDIGICREDIGHITRKRRVPLSMESIDPQF
jgi:uncharacterized protein YjiS (DUF1127 family)